MGLTNIISGSVKSLLKAFPHDYATKIARKLRKDLEVYGQEKEAFTSGKGDVFVSGVRRSFGMRKEINQFEPETIRWIDHYIKDGEVVWDIGANVGLYSSYMAKIPGIKLVSFEPHAATYSELVRNIITNNSNDNREIYALNIALGEHTKLGNMEISSYETGFTSSTVLSEIQREAKGIIARQPIAEFRGDDFLKTFHMPPSHLKIDVDGAEESVLKGAKDVIAGLKTLLIEVEGELLEKFEELSDAYILSAGLHKCKINEPHSSRMCFFSRNPDDIL